MQSLDPETQDITLLFSGLRIDLRVTVTPQPGAHRPEVTVTPTPSGPPDLELVDRFNVSRELEDRLLAATGVSDLAAIPLPFLTFLEGRLHGSSANLDSQSPACQGFPSWCCCQPETRRGDP